MDSRKQINSLNAKSSQSIESAVSAYVKGRSVSVRMFDGKFAVSVYIVSVYIRASYPMPRQMRLVTG